MLKIIVEIAPLIAFFIGYKSGGMLTATLYMLITSVISFGVAYMLGNKINKVNLLSIGLLLFSGSLTLFSGNPIFIKMKATILHIIFASIFYFTNHRPKPAVQYLFQSAIILKDESLWRILNERFMGFFIAMAILNEIVWRNFAESTWVNFKVFGLLPITIIFVFMQVPFLMRNKIDDEQINQEL